MNLVAFSIRTKGMSNFTRRIWTVFTRFGFTSARTRRALHSVVATLQRYGAAPTFFIPAVVLRRHAHVIAEVARAGAEVGIHGYVHNDYRSLDTRQQYGQTERATVAFREAAIPYQGFRNPYLGWTEESLAIFASLGFSYESNEAILHDVIDHDRLPLRLRAGFDKSMRLFQAIPCSTYTIRPHFEGGILRLPISLPDDEILYDRLRMTDPTQLAAIWCRVMQNVYDLGGLYVLNLHPERALQCKDALESLLRYACDRPLAVWVARLADIARWWAERSQFRLSIMPRGPDSWEVMRTGGPDATLLGRHIVVEDQPTAPWFGSDMQIQAERAVVYAARYPGVGLSPRTDPSVAQFLGEQGYPAVPCSDREADHYALYIDQPDGLGRTRGHSVQRRSALIQQVEQAEVPLLHFGCWPNGCRAALAISGDIDSVTIQDFFLRIREVRT